MSNLNARDALRLIYLALVGSNVNTTGLNVVDLLRRIEALGGMGGGTGSGINTSVTSEELMVALIASTGDTSLWYNTTTKTLEFWELVADAVTADTPGEFRRVDAATGWLRRGVN